MFIIRKYNFTQHIATDDANGRKSKNDEAHTTMFIDIMIHVFLIVIIAFHTYSRLDSLEKTPYQAYWNRYDVLKKFKE